MLGQFMGGTNVSGVIQRKQEVRTMALLLVKAGVESKEAPQIAMEMYDAVEKLHEGQMAEARKKDKEIRDKLRQRQKELQKVQNRAMETIPNSAYGNMPIGGYAGSEDFIEEDLDEDNLAVR